MDNYYPFTLINSNIYYIISMLKPICIILILCYTNTPYRSISHLHILLLIQSIHVYYMTLCVKYVHKVNMVLSILSEVVLSYVMVVLILYGSDSVGYAVLICVSIQVVWV